MATLTPLPAHQGLSDLAIKTKEELDSLRKEDELGRAYVTFPSGKKDYAWLKHLSPDFLARREQRKAQLCAFLTSEAEAVAEELTPEELEVQRDHPFQKNPIRAVSRLDISAHPCLHVVDIQVGKERWRLINFYHDVEDETRSELKALTDLNLDPIIPTLVAGNFNCHSPLWLAPGFNWNCTSARVEEWSYGNGLELISTPGLPTR
ncbi:hypothetical protein EDB85DRAFT_2146860 [Lactarius pseudohatsudake]|nr:hypothetical protein EDB85DRAFT_2146860 [Lactarius pseudohatsudake]